MEFRTKSSKRKKSSYKNFISLKARQNINIIVQPKPILVTFLFDRQQVDVIYIYSNIWNSSTENLNLTKKMAKIEFHNLHPICCGFLFKFGSEKLKECLDQ